jgi:hypothetical protein
MDVNGKMWLRNPCHLYIVEISEGNSEQPKTRSSKLVRIAERSGAHLGFLTLLSWSDAFLCFLKFCPIEAAESIF